MNEEKEPVQQEIAPFDVSEHNGDVLPQPVEKNKNKAAAFFRLTATRRIAYSGVLIALAVTLKYFSLPIGGTSVSFFYLPVYLAGALFGPLAGFVVGGVGDMLGATLQYGSPDFVVSLGNSLMGLIMGLAFMLPKLKPQIKLVIGAAVALVVCSIGINTLGNAITLVVAGYDPAAAAQLTGDGNSWFTIWWLMLVLPLPVPRIVMQPIMVAINTAIAIPIYVILKRNLPM